MRILYVVHSIPPLEFSGTPLVAWTFARQAAASGATVAVAFAQPAGAPPVITPPAGIRLLPLAPAPDKPWTLAAYTLPPRDDAAFAALRKFRPDLVHIVDWVNLPAGLLAAVRALKVPVVRHLCNVEDVCAFNEPIRFHSGNRLCRAPLSAQQCGECLVRRLGVVRASLDGPIDEVMAKLAETRASLKDDFSRKVAAKWQAFHRHLDEVYDELVFPCNSFRTYYESVFDLGAVRRRVIEHGIAVTGRPPPAAPRAPGAPLTCVFVGPCTSRKGWDVVEACFARLLPEAGGRIALRAYGARQVAARSPLAGLAGIELLDPFPADRLGAAVAGCDLALLPSPFETFSLVCREMLALGIPVIGSDAFGIPDAVTDGVNGLLIGEANADGLYRALRRVLDDDGLPDRLAAGAAATPLRSPEAEFAEVMALYRSLPPPRR
jgi:glycosyltransferase involved in cell wall biosynthesis